jgi:hypothetical protein
MRGCFGRYLASVWSLALSPEIEVATDYSQQTRIQCGTAIMIDAVSCSSGVDCEFLFLKEESKVSSGTSDNSGVATEAQFATGTMKE